MKQVTRFLHPIGTPVAILCVVGWAVYMALSEAVAAKNEYFSKGQKRP